MNYGSAARWCWFSGCLPPCFSLLIAQIDDIFTIMIAVVNTFRWSAAGGVPAGDVFTRRTTAKGALCDLVAGTLFTSGLMVANSYAALSWLWFWDFQLNGIWPLTLGVAFSLLFGLRGQLFVGRCKSDEELRGLVVGCGPLGVREPEEASIAIPDSFDDAVVTPRELRTKRLSRPCSVQYTIYSLRTGRIAVAAAVRQLGLGSLAKWAWPRSHLHEIGFLERQGMSTPYFQELFADRIGGASYGTGTEIYKFEKIKRAKRKALADYPDRQLLDFGIGENDAMAPEVVRRRMGEEINRPGEPWLCGQRDP